MTDFLSVDEAAELTGYNPDYVRKLVRQKKIQAEKKGPMYWIDLSSLNAYVDQVKREGTQRFNWRKRRTQ